MRSYPNINFSLFSIEETCDFISERVHEDLKTYMNSLERLLVEEDMIFNKIDVQQMLRMKFLQLKEESEQLIRLESFVLLPFIKKKISEGEGAISQSVKDKLFEKQELIMALFYGIKLQLNNFLSKDVFSSTEQIAINDLISLEGLLYDWIYIVQNNIIFKLNIKSSNNEFADQI